MDTTKLGTIAAEGMEVFEKDFEDVEGAYIAEAGVAITVRWPVKDSPDREHEEVLTACTNDSRVYQTGLWNHALELAIEVGEAPYDPTDDDEDEDEDGLEEA